MLVPRSFKHGALPALFGVSVFATQAQGLFDFTKIKAAPLLVPLYCKNINSNYFHNAQEAVAGGN